MTLVTHFTAQQYQESYPPGIEHHFWHRARNGIIAATLFQTGMAAGRWLEIGCGTGIVIDHLRREGIDCIGCDLADAPILDTVREFVSPATGFLDLPVETRSKIDGVLLCDVLEHVPDAASLLTAIRDALPALRCVLVTVPARRELWSVWDDHYGHYRRYNRPSLYAELGRAGLHPIFIRYFFHALYGAMYLTRQKRSEKIEAPQSSLPHRLIGAAFRAEYKLLPCWLPGTSLIAAASA
jgi:SAM-dependent methyltransferase